MSTRIERKIENELHEYSADGWSKQYAASTDAWRTNRLDAGTAGMFELDADGRTAAILIMAVMAHGSAGVPPAWGA